MARVKRGVTGRARHKKILKLAAGYRGRASTCFRVAVQKVEKGLQYAYRDRRARKRELRALWIQRINAAARLSGLTYGQFIHGLTLLQEAKDLIPNRKMLADMAVASPEAFSSLAERVKKVCPLVREVTL